MKTRKIILLPVLLVLTTFLFVVASCGNPNNGNPDGKSSTKMTIDNFYRIKNGMTLKQVTDILGNEGRTLSFSSTMEGIPGVMEKTTTEMWDWNYSEGRDVRIVSITFENNAVTSKSQLGL